MKRDPLPILSPLSSTKTLKALFRIASLKRMSKIITKMKRIIGRPMKKYKLYPFYAVSRTRSWTFV